MSTRTNTLVLQLSWKVNDLHQFMWKKSAIFGSWIIPNQITKNFWNAHGWHLRFYVNLNHRMPSWTNIILKIYASFFIWFKNNYILNFAENWPKLPSVSCKQDFSKFGLKQLTNGKSNQTEIWTTCSLPPK